ncbi:hypothetical protein [Pseudoalteromonas phage vB_PtuP_Slicky01]|nr:hypothetical protein [Pseudoalteromonas phage vB_PtuP_Slicky01]
MWSAIKKFFGIEGVTDSALKIVDRLAGTDWTPQQKADYTLKIMEATKHQSPARRMIATAFTFEQFVLAMTWLGYTVYGNPEVAAQIKDFLVSDVNITMNIIIGFYFLSPMIKK